MTLPKTRSELKKKIIQDKLLPYVCVGCGNAGVWNGKPLSLQLDHINGQHEDRLNNLRFLCPNCHSQTPTYCRGNVKRRSMFYVDLGSKLLDCIDNFNTIRQILRALDLSDHSTQYNKIYRLLEIHKDNPKIIAFKERHIQKQKEFRHAPRPNARKVDRPTKEELSQLVWKLPLTTLARQFGLNSSNTILKWCRDYKISKPTRGYWMKQKHGHVAEPACEVGNRN